MKERKQENNNCICDGVKHEVENEVAKKLNVIPENVCVIIFLAILEILAWMGKRINYME